MNEKRFLFSDGSVLARNPLFGSRMERTAFERGSRTPEWDEAVAELELCPLELCPLDPCDTDPPELWLPPELPE